VRQGPAVVVITGASAGLGRALALEYAGPERTLALIGRDPARLADTAAAARARGAAVETLACDLCQGTAGADFVSAFAAAHPIDLMIVNAGVFSGHHPEREMEDAAEIVSVLRTNLEAAVLTIAAALPAMRARRQGRIALIGSIAAIHPLADAPAYSASKAGLMAYGEALREWLAPDSVKVSLIYPGHIETGQTARHIGALPLLHAPAAAAARIRRGLDRGRAHIAFPRRLAYLARAGRLVPWQVRAYFARPHRFTVKRDD
jgi:short-subunit dehydrogenase